MNSLKLQDKQRAELACTYLLTCKKINFKIVFCQFLLMKNFVHCTI